MISNDKFEAKRQKQLNKMQKRGKRSLNPFSSKAAQALLVLVFLVIGSIIILLIGGVISLDGLKNNLKNKNSDKSNDTEITNNVLYEGFVNNRKTGWLDVPSEVVDNMSKDDIKYMCLEINILSKIERIEREKGFLLGINPYNNETFDDYVIRVKDFRDTFDIRGLYCHLYSGREYLDEWMFNYLKQNYPDFVGDNQNFTTFCINYANDYFGQDKNKFDSNSELKDECETYLRTISVSSLGFYQIPYKSSFINHLENYSQYIPEGMTISGNDDDNNIRYKDEDKNEYRFYQDEYTGDIYIVSKNNENEDKIDFSNRWEMQNFTYIEEYVNERDINVDEMLSKGYYWKNSYNDLDDQKILFKEDRLNNKTHMIFIKENDEG